MGKLILEIQTSIDGFIASPDGKTDWMLWNWGPKWNWDRELQRYHTDLTSSADCILISRQMAEEGFILHWKNAIENKKDQRYAFAKHIVETPKIVITTTLNKTIPIPGGWDNTDIIQEDLVNAIAKLKQRYNNILVYGGSTLVSSLIKAGLIDEFHFLVNPVAIGSGLTIFRTLNNKQNMSLVKVASFQSSIVLLHYNVNRIKG
jgi:dihydrofolate reductase